MAATVTTETLFIDYGGPAYPTVERLTRSLGVPSVSKIANKLVFDSDSRRNPRTAEYMRDVAGSLGHEPGPRITHVTAASDLDRHAVEQASAIVLLWRDANGSGWGPIERVVLAHKSPQVPVKVINGRRRSFELTPMVRRGYLVRRLVEKSLFVEMLLFAGLAATTPFVFLWDAVAGPRRSE